MASLKERASYLKPTVYYMTELVVLQSSPWPLNDIFLLLAISVRLPPWHLGALCAVFLYVRRASQCDTAICL